MKIVFFLEYQKKNGNRYTLHGDFATIKGAEEFFRHATGGELREGQEIPTGLRIDGIIPGIRLFEDNYYTLDVDCAIITRTENTSFESYIIDYSNVSFEQYKKVIERDTKAQNNLDKAKSRMPKGKVASVFHSFDDLCDDEKEFVLVNDVGQGNWNEYHCGNNIPLVFDIGADRYASNKSARSLIGQILPQYQSLEKKPVVIISHWDLDHYRCLLSMSDLEINLFDCFIVMETLPTATAKKAYDLIEKNLGVNILAVTERLPTKKAASLMIHPLHKAKKLSIYQGVGNNTNNTGFIVAVSNNHTIVLLSGDCSWSQLNHLTRAEGQHKKKRLCHLVVPHHGSGKDCCYKGFVLPSSWLYGKAAVSVGINMYGHPNPGVLKYLNSLFGSHASRTDKTKTAIRLKM